MIPDSLAALRQFPTFSAFMAAPDSGESRKVPQAFYNRR
jgi:hypothetical protein